MLTLLKQIVSRTDNTLKVTAETLNESIAEMTALEKEESKISHELTSLKWRLSEMRRLMESVDQYGQALQVQRDRLKVSDWLNGQHSTESIVPFAVTRWTKLQRSWKFLSHHSVRSKQSQG